jgi:acyl-CoA dehydrogenase
VDFAPSPRAAELVEQVGAFLRERVVPAEREAGFEDGDWTVPAAIPELKREARERGLWNLFLPDVSGLSNVDYAPLAELMGRTRWGAEVMNCSAPDTGNMEVLHGFGSAEQKARWLQPLLDGEIRSAFCMTEPDVASSDATNMQATARVDGDEVVVDGVKWWSTGIGHPDCELLIVMALTDPTAHRHQQHSMVIVPRDSPGVTVERMLRTMGWYDAPSGHGQVRFDGVRVPLSNVIGSPGSAFAIAQGRLGPGRIHHCMRAIGLAEVALELACERAVSRVAFGKPIANLGGNRERIADARTAIDQARLLVLHAAWLLDTQGLLGALSAISQIKVVVPNVLQSVVDMAIQLHGGAGLSQDFPLGAAWTVARALRLADGPDEVHRGVVAKVELGPYLARAKERAAVAEEAAAGGGSAAGSGGGVGPG